MKTDKRWLHLSTIQGFIAMWAVRQSPYHNPDGLNKVLTTFRMLCADQFDRNDMAQMNRLEVKQLLRLFLYPIPEFQAWNQRKNGNQAPYGFCSRYDKPDPDNDFIDLDALTGNVVREMFKELDRDYESDHRALRPFTWGKLKSWFRYKFSRPQSPECVPGSSIPEPLSK